MTGCFPFSTRMHRQLRTLGYREIALAVDCAIGSQGLTARGHEFHYSDLLAPPDNEHIDKVYHVVGRKGREMHAEGYHTRRTLGSYIHLHFGSNPQIAKSFVQSCRVFVGR